MSNIVLGAIHDASAIMGRYRNWLAHKKRCSRSSHSKPLHKYMTKCLTFNQKIWNNSLAINAISLVYQRSVRTAIRVNANVTENSITTNRHSFQQLTFPRSSLSIWLPLETWTILHAKWLNHKIMPVVRLHSITIDIRPYYNSSFCNWKVTLLTEMYSGI